MIVNSNKFVSDCSDRIMINYTSILPDNNQSNDTIETTDLNKKREFILKNNNSMQVIAKLLAHGTDQDWLNVYENVLENRDPKFEYSRTIFNKYYDMYIKNDYFGILKFSLESHFIPIIYTILKKIEKTEIEDKLKKLQELKKEISWDIGNNCINYTITNIYDLSNMSDKNINIC